MPTIEDLFSPESLSVRQLFAGGRAYSVPTYQRSYRWESETIAELFEAVLRGLERLSEESDGDSVTFIGAIITLQDVQEDVAQSPPESACRLIDGQQRLTTILMSLIAGHDQLRIQKQVIDQALRDSDETGLQTLTWLRDQTSLLLGELKECLAYNPLPNDPAFLDMPRITREKVDRWSNTHELSKYESPIGRLLSTYLSSLEGPRAFTPTVPTQISENAVRYGSTSDSHITIINRYTDSVARCVSLIAEGTELSDTSDPLNLVRILRDDSEVLNELFQGIPDGAQLLADLRELTANAELATATRLLVFLKFFTHCVALTAINANNESYAFDLFDSLNGGGEPLTALETFVPLVVSDENENQVAPSAMADIRIVSDLVERDDLSRETSDLLTSFALAEEGKKLSREHNDQRRWLRKRYESGAYDDKSAMTKQLVNTAVTYLGSYQRGDIMIIDAPGAASPMSAESLFGLRYLRELNHKITVAPVSRYVANYRAANEDAARLDSLNRATLAITAFSTLWRALFGGANKIDSAYRKVMSGIDEDWVGLARTRKGSCEANQIPDPMLLGATLRRLLVAAGGDSVETEDGWVDRVFEADLYKQKAVTRMLLFLANHNAAAAQETGLLQDGVEREDTDFLRPSRWDEEKYLTIEHIAPQTEPTDEDPTWSEELYVGTRKVNRIGNLTLSPLLENIQLGNKSWPEKRMIYRALSAEGVEEVEGAFQGAIDSGVPLSDALKTSIEIKRRYIPTMSAIGAFGGDWDLTLVDLRSKDILKRSWTILDKWLKAEPED